jgi:hypothetical protein
VPIVAVKYFYTILAMEREREAFKERKSNEEERTERKRTKK